MEEQERVKEQLIIAKIIANSIQGTISHKESQELEYWLSKSRRNKELFTKLKHESTLKDKVRAYRKINTSEARKPFLDRLQKSTVSGYSKNIMKYAAILMISIGITYSYQKGFFITEQNNIKLEISEEAITLQLENGNIEVITSEGNRKILNNKGVVVGVQEGNKLNYKNNEKSEVLVYNELKIPYGKIFQLELSDGTIVHLNAGTSLKYPVKFIEGKNRQVFLKGEAYFDVAKDTKHPFVVNTNNINIRVLGTRFNVSSYPEDNNVNTVLVEGSVSLYKKGQKYVKENASLLKPGFKASWNKQGKEIAIDKVDTSIYTGWVEGKIIFKDLAFKSIRKKLERHYNVTITNNNEALKQNTYNAIFDIENIEEVLETLNKSYPIKYTIGNNQITIN